MTDTPRTSSAIDTLADGWVDTLVDLVPMVGTYIGRNEYNDRFGDLSPEGHERLVDAARTTLNELRRLEPVDDVDVVTKDALSSELELELELNDAQWQLR